MLLEILSVAVTADPAKLREPYGFSMLLEAKFDELEARFKGRTDDWLDLLEMLSSRLPRYGDFQCSFAVGERYLALLQATHADPRRIAQAALGQARIAPHVGAFHMATRDIDAALAQLPAEAANAALRSALLAQRAALAH